MEILFIQNNNLIIIKCNNENNLIIIMKSGGCLVKEMQSILEPGYNAIFETIPANRVLMRMHMNEIRFYSFCEFWVHFPNCCIKICVMIIKIKIQLLEIIS